MVTIVTLRWLFSWSLTPRNLQLVRALFLQRFLTAYPDALLITENDEQISARLNGHICTFRMEALYLRCREFPFRVEEFIQEVMLTFELALREPVGLPQDWQQHILALVLRLDAPMPDDMLFRPVIDALGMGYVVEVGEGFRWITQQDLESSGVNADELHTYALRNLERSCNRLVIDTVNTMKEGDDRVLLFHTHDGLDASRLLLPSFYQRFTGRFGDEDLLVGIPTRDTLIMVSVSDQPHANLLAWRTNAEYTSRAYPLLSTVLRVTSDGLETWAAE